MDQTKGYKSTVFMIIFLDAIVIVLCCLTVKYMIEENSQAYAQGKPASTNFFCLPCSEIQKHPDDGIPYGIEQHDTKCCAKNESFIYTLVNEYITSWHGKKLHEENPQFSRCRERILPKEKPLMKLSLSKQQNGGSTDTEWDEIFHRTDAISYKDGFVKVGKSGLYFIYSKVSFMFRKNITMFPELPRQHQIVLKRYASTENFDDLVAQGTTSNCIYEGLETGSSHNSASFIGSVYRLHKGDQVAVKVHDRKQLHDASAHHFGLHMI